MYESPQLRAAAYLLIKDKCFDGSITGITQWPFAAKAKYFGDAENRNSMNQLAVDEYYNTRFWDDEDGLSILETVKSTLATEGEVSLTTTTNTHPITEDPLRRGPEVYRLISDNLSLIEPFNESTTGKSSRRGSALSTAPTLTN